ncbi:AAA family ATPase [Geodermatophilus sp. SYSU D01106]
MIKPSGGDITTEHQERPARRKADTVLSTARVASLEVAHFRGFAHTVTVPFGPAAKPTSVLIFGENGSGKSSVVDAVEWACQGRIGRSASVRSGPGVLHEGSKEAEAEVRVLLSDGRSVARRASLDLDEKIHVSGDSVPKDFARVPMSLKRADILRFLETVPRERGRLFLDHALAGSVKPAPTAAIDPQELVDQRHEAKKRMHEVAGEIAASFDAPAPSNSSEIDDLLVQHVYKGLPPDHWARVTVPRRLEGHLREIATLRRQISDINRLKMTAKRVAPGAPRRLQEMHAILGDVSGWLTSAFHRITGATYVARIDAEFGASSDISIDIWVTLANGARRTPQQVFSEGYQDLIALLYFLAVMRAAGQAGQARVLILDDVLQSVDSGIRLSVMELVVEEFRDWQLLVTVHDRLWRLQLQEVFRRAKHPVTDVEIRTWEFGAGPQVVTASPVDPATSLRTALTTHDPHVVAAVAGRVLEQISDRMSWTIPITVQRRRHDDYTLGHLWPGVLKTLAKTTCAAAAQDADRWLHLRNAAGAHYNEWAESLSWTDAEQFGQAVLTMLDTLRCVSCGLWVERKGQSSFACRCGAVSVTPVKVA